MNKWTTGFLAAAILAAFTFNASAQAPAKPAPAAKHADCSKIADPSHKAACETHLKASQTCKAGPQHQACMMQHYREYVAKHPHMGKPHDCNKVADPAHRGACMSHNKALDTCKGKVGPEHEKCMMGHYHAHVAAKKPS